MNHCIHRNQGGITKMSPDKNLINTVKDLETTPVTSQQAQQFQQKKNDRRKEMLQDDAKE